MKRAWFIFLFFTGIFLIYFLFSPQVVTQSDIFRVEDYLKINEADISVGETDGFFYNDNECGFFTINSGLNHYKKAVGDEIILANKYFYLVYKKVGDTIDVFSTRGELISSIKNFGYPYIPEELPIFYVLESNGMGISLYTREGMTLFEGLTFSSLITSVSTDRKINSLISTLDGMTYLYNVDGELVLAKDSDQSRINFVKSSTIDLENSNIAICTGIDPEFVEVFNYVDNNKLLSIKTDMNFRYNIFMKFYDNKLYFESLNGIKFFDLLKPEEGNLAIKGKIKEVKFGPLGNVFVITSEKSYYYLSVFSSKGLKKYYKEFLKPVSNIGFIDDKTFYFKCKDYIVKMAIKGTA